MTIRARIIILAILLVIILGGAIFLYLWLSGKIKIGAEAVIGCQNSGKISSFFGRPGTNLTSYNFFGNEVTVNEKLVPYLDNIQKEIKAAGIDYDFSNVQTYNYRSKRGGGGTSLHSWGIALDINPDRNPQGGPSDLPGKVIDIFKKNGFFWGGDWGGRDNDPMHFEWYGAALAGDILDTTSKQRILSVATAINGSGSPNNDGQFDWLVTYGDHEITAQARGYKDSKFKVNLTCFDQENMDIGLEPLPSDVPGSVSGKISFAGNYPLLVPANIYLDGRLVGVSNLDGDYTIPNVHEGNHKIDAKILFFPGNGTSTQVVPGDTLKNINILIGKWKRRVNA